MPDRSSSDPVTRALAALCDLQIALSGELDPARLRHEIARGAVEVLDATIGGCASWDASHNELTLEGWYGNAPPPVPLGSVLPPGSPLERVLHDHRTLLVIDALARDRVPEWEQRLGWRALVTTPLRSGHRSIGLVFAAQEDAALRFDAKQARLLELLAGHATIVLASAAEHAASARRSARSSELARALAGLSDAQRSTAAIERALDCATTILGADRAAVFVVDSDQEVVEVVGRRISRRYLDQVAASYRRSVGALLRVVRAPLFISDITSDPRTTPIHELAATERLRSMLLVPLARGDEVLGAIALYYDVEVVLSTEDTDSVRTLADHLALALAHGTLRARAEQQLGQLRMLDAMTRAVSASADEAERCRRGAETLVEHGGATAAWVFLLQGDHLVLSGRAGASVAGHDGATAAARHALAGHGSATGSTLSDGVRDPGRGAPLVAAPIGRPDRPLGALVLAPPRPMPPEARAQTITVRCSEPNLAAAAQEFTATAAAQLAAAIQNARLIEALASQGARLAGVIADLPAGVLVFDAEDRLLHYNQLALTLYGLGQRDAHGWTPADFMREVSGCFDDPTVPNEIARRMRDQRDAVHRMQFEVVRPERRVIERTSAPFYLPDGRRCGQVVIYHDVTELGAVRAPAPPNDTNGEA